MYVHQICHIADDFGVFNYDRLDRDKGRLYSNVTQSANVGEYMTNETFFTLYYFNDNEKLRET
jgi:hypothetical protein